MKATIINNTEIFGGYYDEDNIPEGKTAVSNVEDTFGIVKLLWKNESWVEGLSDEDKMNYEKEKNEKYTKERYDFHRENGWECYQDFRAKIVYDIDSGKITESKAFQIESHLGAGFNRISNTGDWKTGLLNLENTISIDSVVNEYKNEAIVVFQNYIAENYEK